MASVPTWLRGDRAADKAILDFLSVYQADVTDHRYRSADLSDFFAPESTTAIQFSNFVAKKDSLFFTHLIRNALERFPRSRLLIDLCTGSAIPIISAALHTKTAVPFLGIDVDASAISVAAANILKLGLQERISVRRADLQEFLQSEEVRGAQEIILAANPPYLPCPPELKDPKYLPVNGGIDGTCFIELILAADVPVGTVVAIQWGSLTNSVQVLSWIKNSFEVSAVQVWEVPLGKYSLSSEIYPYLEKLRDQGISSYFGRASADPSQLVVGAVLRKVRS